MNALLLLQGKKRIPLALALLLSLAGVLNSQSAPAPIACFTGQMYGRDIMIALAALIMFMIVSLVYMAAKVMGRMEMEAWAKNEAYQVTISCLIAGSMIFLANIACWVSVDFSTRSGLGSNDAFQINEKFLSTQYEITLNSIYYMYSLRFWLEYLSSYNTMMATNPQYLVQRFPGLSAVAQNMNTAITVFSILAGNIMVQKLIMQIIYQTAFSLVLPIGLVLRIFPFARDAGAFLIAVAFGFYVVFPLLYVMEAEVVSQLPDEGMPRIFGLAPAFVLPGSPSFMVTSLFLSPLFWFFLVIKNLDFVLVATFFPALNITITSVFIKSLTKAIIHQTG